MEYWFTADTHFGHANILRYCKRPFSSIEEHDEELIRLWNERVKQGDQVFHAGDFGFGHKERMLTIRKRLKGRIHLILGNHDLKLNREVTATFESVRQYAEVSIPDAARPMTQRVVLFHYPLRSWHGRAYGSWALTGHSHGTLVDKDPQLQLDVGVDCFNYAPVPYETIRNIMSARSYELARIPANKERTEP